MPRNIKPGTPPHPSKDSAASRARDDESPPHSHPEPERDEPNGALELELANSVITFERGPVGILARVDRADRTIYAGPLTAATVAAIREVAR